MAILKYLFLNIFIYCLEPLHMYITFLCGMRWDFGIDV